MFPTKLVISLIDIWPFHRDFASNLQQMDVKWAPITPIDHDPMQRATKEHLEKADYQLAMSLHGKRMMEDEGMKNIRYMPHGVETSVYKPVPRHKEIYNARGKFLVGCVASNIEPQDRKGWHPTLEAYGRFHQKHPDSALYCHTVASRAMQGLDLTAIAARFGDFEIYTPDYWRYLIGEPDEMLAQHYSNMDVLLMLTRGEGFGVPIIEAQACGTPVIVTDWTAPSDLVGAGWKIPIVGKRWTVLEGYWAEPSVDAAVEALEEAYDLWKSKKLDKEYKDKAIEFAKQFDFDTVHEKYMEPFLEEVLGGPST
jgi:glycosyltransferase involved in cell wall biosynthesis